MGLVKAGNPPTAKVQQQSACVEITLQLCTLYIGCVGERERVMVEIQTFNYQSTHARTCSLMSWLILCARE